MQDSFVLHGKPLHPCWFDIQIPELNATLHCSYYHATTQKDLSSLINDAFTIAGKHNTRVANYRKRSYHPK